MRITPAPAGSTMKKAFMVVEAGDHPRACGEHYPHTALNQFHEGSPPRLRGALRGPLTPPVLTGITPAPAGSTHKSTEYEGYAEDHPRACGEHSHSKSNRCSSSGSPPRLRGARILSPQVRLVKRITPAPAGSTLHPHYLHRAQ